MSDKRNCTKCKIEKPLTEFHNSKAGKFGKTSYCKECHKNPQPKYKSCSLEEEVKLFFAAMGKKLNEREMRLACQRLRSSSSPLQTLSQIEQQFGCSAENYAPEKLPSNTRAVEQYTEDWQLIGEYESTREAARVIAGKSEYSSGITLSANSGGELIRYGFRWKYVELKPFIT
jgi:hypothetical protein